MEKTSLYQYLIPSGIISFLIISFSKIKITKRQQTPVRTRRLVCLPAVPSICHIQLPKEANDNEGCAATRYVIGTPLSFYLQILGKKTKLVLDCTAKAFLASLPKGLNVLQRDKRILGTCFSVP